MCTFSYIFHVLIINDSCVQRIGNKPYIHLNLHYDINIEGDASPNIKIILSTILKMTTLDDVTNHQ